MKKLYLLMLLAAMSTAAHSQTFNSAADGNWSDPATWTPAGPPPAGAWITVLHNITLDTNFTSANGSILLPVGASIVQDQPTRILEINSSSISNNGTIAASQFLFNDGTLHNIGVIQDVDSFHNGGIINNDGTIRTAKLTNVNTINNNYEMWGLVDDMDEVINHSYITNDTLASFKAANCISDGSGMIENHGFMRLGECYSETHIRNFGDLEFANFTMDATMINAGQIMCSGTLRTWAIFINHVDGLVLVGNNFYNGDSTLNTMTEYYAYGDLIVADSWFNFGSIRGLGGSITMQDTSYNAGPVVESKHFCDSTPPPNYPYIDFPIYSPGAQFVYCGHDGVDEATRKLDVDVYPNPANNVVNISTAESCSIQLLDARGKVCLSAEHKELLQTIDLSALQAGLYFLVFTGENLFHVEKIMKN